MLCPVTSPAFFPAALNLQIRKITGHIPVDKLDYRHLYHWAKSMMAKGKAAFVVNSGRSVGMFPVTGLLIGCSGGVSWRVRGGRRERSRTRKLS